MAFRQTKIKRKLMAILLSTSGTVLILTCAAFFTYELLTFRRTMLLQLNTLGQIVATNSTAALAFDNVSDATEVLAALKAERHIIGACLYDNDGRLFATYPDDRKVSTFPSSPDKDGFRFSQSQLRGFLPVVQGGKRLGTLYIQSDLGAVYERFRLYGLIVALVIAVSFLVAFLLSSVLQRQISGPILALTDVAQTISERRDYSVRAAPIGGDELARLTEAFNQMLDRIEQQNHTVRESAELFRGMAETMPQIVWTARPDGKLEYFNQRWFDYTGMSVDEALTLGWSPALHPDDLQETLDQWAKSVANESRYEIEHRFKRAADGAYRWHIARAAPLRDEAGAVVKWVGTCTDIDDSKRAEEEVRNLNVDLEKRVSERTSELQAAVAELEAFSYSVSHDLRAPLRHVEGYVEMLTADTKGLLSGNALRFLKTITEATVEMGQLIDDLLAFSRMGRVELSHRRVSLDGLVKDSVRGLESRTRGRNITWSVAPLPEVFGDASVLKQAVSNLIDNALKYSRDRDPAVIEIGVAGEEEGRVILFVRDNGAGFEMQYAHKLFGVFQRLHRSDEFEGTGIGLATVRRIISRHGGRIWAEGKVGEGATFYFTLKPAIND